MSDSSKTTGPVLLVGSLPFDTVEDAMRATGAGLGAEVTALPDGEVGDRKMWVGFLPMHTYSKHPDIEQTSFPTKFELVVDFEEPEPGVPIVRPGAGKEFQWTFKVKPGVDELRFDLLYGKIAQDSYKTFCKLRDEGVIAKGVRFQVSIPATTSATHQFFEDPEQWPMVHAAYNAAVRRAIDTMLETIPAADLLIQFDMAWEVNDLSIGDETYFPYWPDLTYDEKFALHTTPLIDLVNSVPEDVMVGLHWCYGTWGGWPMTAMEDVSLCVDLSNHLVRNANRHIDYVHMPVTDEPGDTFFAPLADLDIGDTKLYLGLVHSDGIEGSRKRIELAKRYRADFGVAAVCGYGRENPADLPDIMALHHESAAVVLT